jgi:UDP-N-acetylmuramyl pentapeptide synthase
VNEIPLTAAWVAEVMAGTLAAGERVSEFAGVSIDTRTLTPGELFIAIRGERFDGTDFAQSAIERGAAGIVVPRDRGLDRRSKASAARFGAHRARRWWRLPGAPGKPRPRK